MLDGHFDLATATTARLPQSASAVRYPSTIWRFAQDLLDVLPASVLDETEVVAGPATGGALLAHTVAGLLDSRRAIGGPPTLFAPFTIDAYRGPGLSRFYRQQTAGRKILLVDDVRNTGQTLARCATLVRSTGGTVIATAEIYDRMESIADAGAPNFALAEYKAPENYSAATVRSASPAFRHDLLSYDSRPRGPGIPRIHFLCPVPLCLGGPSSDAATADIRAA
jgi:orotate phosphoribosyltransferase